MKFGEPRVIAGDWRVGGLKILEEFGVKIK